MGQRLADPEDMLRIVPGSSLAKVTTSERERFCQDASDEASGELNNVYRLPLTAWGQDLRRYVATIAVYEALTMRGFDSADQGSSLLRRATFARDWLKRVGNGELSPPDIVDSTPDVDESGPVVVTSPRRGWS